MNEKKMKTVCLCGSTRFHKEFEEANYALTMAGFVVVGPGVFGHTIHSDRPLSEEDKARLDCLHLAKIDMADFVVVINPDNYIGESTKREIVYAELTLKPVYYLFD